MNSDTFKILTLTVGVVLLAQLGGFFDGINTSINSTVPLVDSSVVQALTFLGDDPVLLAVLGAAVLFDIKKYRKLSKPTLAFILSALTGLAAVGLIKYSLSVPRPRSLPGAGVSGKGAFPSGHTFRAALIASYVSDRWERFKSISWTLAVLVGITRLLLHYHWLSDVIFSLLFAPWLYSLMKALMGGRPHEMVR